MWHGWAGQLRGLALGAVLLGGLAMPAPAANVAGDGGVSARAPADVDTRLRPTLGGRGPLPTVCSYLGVVNGTRIIDPSFAPKPAPPRAATPIPTPAILGRTAPVLLPSATSVAPALPNPAYCHPAPPLIPIRAAP